MLTKQAYARAQQRGELFTLARYGLLAKVAYDPHATLEFDEELQAILGRRGAAAARARAQREVGADMPELDAILGKRRADQARARAQASAPPAAPAPTPSGPLSPASISSQLTLPMLNTPAAAPHTPAAAAPHTPAAAAPSHRNKILAGLAGLGAAGAAGGVIHHRRQQAKQRRNAMLALAAGGALGLGGAAFAAHRRRQREMEE